MIFVVVPAFNEEKKIGRVLSDLFEHGYDKVVVVDDGSQDDTYGKAKELGAMVLRHAINRGQGAALETGNKFAVSQGAEIVVHFDGDGQFKAESISGAVKLLKENNVDVIFGSRFLTTESKIPFFKKYFIIPVARIINNFITGLNLSDAHNGFRVLTKNAAERIVITQDGMAHNSEITKLVKEYSLAHLEYPIEVIYEEFGQGVGGGMRILRDILVAKIIK